MQIFMKLSQFADGVVPGQFVGVIAVRNEEMKVAVKKEVRVRAQRGKIRISLQTYVQ